MGIGYNYQQILQMQGSRLGWCSVLGIFIYAGVFLFCVRRFFLKTSAGETGGRISGILGLLPVAAVPLILQLLWNNDILYFTASICMICAYGSAFYHRRGSRIIFDLLFAAALSGAYVLLALVFSLLVSAASGTAGFAVASVFWENAQYGILAYYLAESLAVWALTWLFIRWVKARTEKKQMSWRYLVLGFFPLAFVFLLVEILGSSDWIFLWYGGAPVLACMALIAGMNVFTVYLFGYMERQQKQELELSLYRQQEELLFHQYKELEEKYQTSRKVVHDVKNHMQMLDSLYQQGEFEAAERYRQDINGLLRTLERVRYTDHPMLNLLLNAKLNQEELRGVELKVRIGDADLTFMRDIDITTIFANLLDNALEAVKSAEGHPFLRLELEHIRAYIVIRLENSRGSQKKSPARHMGLGLKNVENALSFYGGTMTAQEEKTCYRINIMIPVDSHFGGKENA